MADLYSRVALATKTASQPEPLPAELVGLADETLADLPKALNPVPAGFEGAGYWPVDVERVPFDPRAETETGTYRLTVDEGAGRVTAMPDLRDLTTDEIAALPRPVFPPISDRQFFQALATAPYGIITAQESLDAVKTGEIPAVMQSVIDALPPQAQYEATMLVAGGTSFERDNPLVEVFGASQNMDAAAIDAFWRFAGRL